jgi:flavin-dependent dehydrogenase
VKESVQFVDADGKDSRPYFFPDRDPGEWSYTWQIKRDEFDQAMLEHAQKHGVDVRFNAPVRSVIFEGTRAVGVVAKLDGAEREVRARVVVDASGQGTLLSRQLGLKVADPALRNVAIYSYFRGAHRDEGRNAGATLVVRTKNRNGWFWVIPLADDITSVGVVAPPEQLTIGRGGDPARTFTEEVQDCPGVAWRVRNATQVDKVYVCSDFSYSSRQIAGDGWVLIGDAFGFLDPLYSSGVMLGLKSGEMAADAIHAALEAGDVSGERLGEFGPRFISGMQLIKNLVCAYYDTDFSFAKFMKAHPQHQDRLVRLLIGDVFNDDVAAIFDDMRHYTRLPDPPVMATATNSAQA